MAKKKRVSIVGMLEEAVGDIANAASVAATGSEIGVLELAVKDELKPARKKSAPKAKTKSKKKRAAKKKPRKPNKKKRT